MKILISISLLAYKYLPFMTRLKQLLRGVQNIYHQLRGQHLSQKKGGETHFALIQYTVPTEFLGRSYPATASGGKMAKQASQVCAVPSISHTQTQISINLSVHLNRKLLQHRSVQLSSKLQFRRHVVIAYALHLAIPSFALAKANL